MNHVCPACGKWWECACADDVKKLHTRLYGRHPEEIACTPKCATHLAALVGFLRRYGL